MTDLKTPRCPGCDEPGKAVVDGLPPNPEQLFCHNAVCHVVTWNGYLTVQENARAANWIDLPGADR